MTNSVRIVLVGFGAINRRVAELLKSQASSVEIVGVIVRNPEALPPEIRSRAALVTHPGELVGLKPDLIVEAASAEAVRQWGEPALRAAPRLVVTSTSAFADEELLARLRETACRCSSQLVVSPGAIAGVDAIAAAATAGLDEVRHRIVKHPDRWGRAQDAQGVAAGAPGAHSPRVLFRGSAREAAQNYPLNANVTIVSALAGVGFDRTIVELVADASANLNRHEIYASGHFGKLSMIIENRPLADNPKSSEQAALALVRLIQNQLPGLVI